MCVLRTLKVNMFFLSYGLRCCCYIRLHMPSYRIGKEWIGKDLEGSDLDPKNVCPGRTKETSKTVTNDRRCFGLASKLALLWEPNSARYRHTNFLDKLYVKYSPNGNTSKMLRYVYRRTQLQCVDPASGRLSASTCSFSWFSLFFSLFLIYIYKYIYSTCFCLIGHIHVYIVITHCAPL
jgi:hypothetical protein